MAASITGQSIYSFWCCCSEAQISALIYLTSKVGLFLFKPWKTWHQPTIVSASQILISSLKIRNHSTMNISWRVFKAFEDITLAKSWCNVISVVLCRWRWYSWTWLFKRLHGFGRPHFTVIPKILQLPKYHFTPSCSWVDCVSCKNLSQSGALKKRGFLRWFPEHYPQSH